MSSYEILPGFATAQFVTDNPVLTPRIYMCVRDALKDVKGRRGYVFIMFYWRKDGLKDNSVVLIKEHFEPTNSGFLLAKALLKEQALLKFSQGYFLDASNNADLDEYQGENQHKGQKSPSFMAREDFYPEGGQERPSHSYQLGAEASQKDRVLAWCDQNRCMLERLSPEAIVLAWLESGNKV